MHLHRQPHPRQHHSKLFSHFFSHGGHQYLVVGDCLSGWVEVFSSSAGTTLAGAAGLIRHLHSFFATFGVPEELSSDGGPEFRAGSTEAFLKLWGIRHIVSSAYFPQSNGRAEVTVKTAKRLLRSNTGPTGSLDHDLFVRAMLKLRNTPDPDCKLSPAQIIFGRPLRDSLSFVNRLEKYSNPHVLLTWRQAWKAKEESLCSRITRTTESLRDHSRPLHPLAPGDRIFIQNQQGNNPTKWDRSGIVESLGNDQYKIKVDGSGRLTLRNRRFLRAYTPVTLSIEHQPVTLPRTQNDNIQTPQPPIPLLDSNLPCDSSNPPLLSQGRSTPITKPHDEAKDTHLTTTMEDCMMTGDIPGDHEHLSNSNPHGIPSPTIPETESSSVDVPQPPSPPACPRRDRRPPKYYDAESRKWIAR